jgi:hypothetical protein
MFHRNKMKKQLFIILLVVVSVTAFTQDNKQYLFFNTGGGLHGLRYNLNNGDQAMGPGFTLNANYEYFFSPNWGVFSGLGLQSAKALATLNYMSVRDATDIDGDSYKYRTYYSGWNEMQNVLFLDIPLGALYKYPLDRRFDLLASSGLTISIPLLATYKVTSGQVTTTGYYKEWDVELTDMPQYNFSTVTDRYSGDIKMKTSLSFNMEAGGLYHWRNNLDLYLGTYFNYGLNNIVSTTNKPVYQSDGTYNGILGSELVNKVRLMSLGLKVGIQWNMTGK